MVKSSKYPKCFFFFTRRKITRPIQIKPKRNIVNKLKYLINSIAFASYTHIIPKMLKTSLKIFNCTNEASFFL